MNANSFRADPRRARAFSEPRPQTRRGLNFRSLSLVAWLAIAVVAAGARDASAQIDPGGATIIGLSIVFDEGTDPGVGFVFLDNITVEVNGVAKTWTFAGDNAGSDLTLHPSGFGEHSYAAWKAQQGQAESRVSANQALYFQKMTATATVAAGVAVIGGLEGLPASSLTGLSWEHRDDGHCGAGAPRWNLFVEDASGSRHTIFLGCATAEHSPGGAPGWTRDSYAAGAIDDFIRVGGGQVPPIRGGSGGVPP